MSKAKFLEGAKSLYERVLALEFGQYREAHALIRDHRKFVRHYVEYVSPGILDATRRGGIGDA